MKAALFAVALGSLVAGCGHIEMKDVVLRADEGASAPRSRAALYMSSQKPPRPMIEVALLDATGTGDDAAIDQMTAALVNRATQLGCDAVVKVHIEAGRTATHIYGVCARWAAVATVAPAKPAKAPEPAPAPKVVPAPESDEDTEAAAPAPLPAPKPRVVPAAI